MSREGKRTWSEQVEEALNDEKAMNEKTTTSSNDSSRENSNSRKKSKPNGEFKQSKPKKPVELETDSAILQRRQKQIDYGKNTVGYANYTQQIPPDERTKDHPKTPDKYTKYSRRAWDMLIKIWRKKLHEFDNDGKVDDKDDKVADDDDKVADNDEDDDDDLNVDLSELEDY